VLGVIKKNDSLETTITDKPAVIALLRWSPDAVRATFTETPDTELELGRMLLGGAYYGSPSLRARTKPHARSPREA